MATRKRRYTAPTDKQLHVGMRFPPDLAEMMTAIVDEANNALRARGFPPTVTVSGCVKAWLGERIVEEHGKLRQRQVGEPNALKGMGVRITTGTSITHKGFAIEALKAAGLSYREVSPTSLLITSGDLSDATIDLVTGHISGDAHDGNRKALGTLRRAYTEAKFRHGAAKDGVEILERHVEKDGSIRLHCRMPSGAK